MSHLSEISSHHTDACLPVLPSYYFAVTHSALRSITSARLPPGDDQGQPQYGEDPPCLIFGSHDGSASMVDLRDTNNILDLNKARSEFDV